MALERSKGPGAAFEPGTNHPGRWTLAVVVAAAADVGDVGDVK